MKDKVDAKPKKEKTDPKPADGGKPGLTSGVLPEAPKPSNQTPSPQGTNQNPQKLKHDLWSFFAEILSPIIIAVMTIVITGVTYYQWDATDGQLTEMKKATEQVDKSLDFLKTQTELAKNSLISSQ